MGFDTKTRRTATSIFSKEAKTQCSVGGCQHSAKNAVCFPKIICEFCSHRVMKNKDLKASITHSLFHYHICRLKRKKKSFGLCAAQQTTYNQISIWEANCWLQVPSCAYTHNKHGQGGKLKCPITGSACRNSATTRRANARKPTGDMERRAHMLQRCWKSTLLKVVYWPLDLRGDDEPQSPGPSGFGVRRR